MAEYIEKEALKNKLRAYNCTSTSDNVDYNRGLNDALRYVVPMIIAGQPTEDVVPAVHGRWEAVLEDVWNLPMPVCVGWRCSECGREEQHKEPYCNCGARMDGE